MRFKLYFYLFHFFGKYPQLVPTRIANLVARVLILQIRIKSRSSLFIFNKFPIIYYEKAPNI